MVAHVGPVEAAAAEEHVSDERLDWRLADESHEEELFDDLRTDAAQRGHAQEQLAEARRLVGVLSPHVLLQRALRLLLETLDVHRVRQATRICKHKHTVKTVSCTCGFDRKEENTHNNNTTLNPQCKHTACTVSELTCITITMQELEFS